MLIRMSIVMEWSRTVVNSTGVVASITSRRSHDSAVAYFSGLHPASHITDGTGDSR